MENKCVVVIPSRFGSVRLPGKPLADIHGKPMVQRVYERALKSGVAEVVIATDDERILQVCKKFGAHVELTDKAHQSGTDRISELATRLNWPDDKIIINVQGDEPFLPPGLISQVKTLLENDVKAAMATLVTPINTMDEWEDPNTVKVVTDCNDQALYFSRAPIPWPRDNNEVNGLRHIGIYGYRAWALKKLALSPPCPLEKRERLEQLRALWLGLPIRVATACIVPPKGVDTTEDLEAIRQKSLKSFDVS
ncbi:MAG: 3-deoxy-manno-octulosonate cytidylyltransferase [Gammaproteobacteria bacterium]|nr:3-deoxy-manno-octulosonate cytidylyltransferase [Gammaproteobacteria bacterium]